MQNFNIDGLIITPNNSRIQLKSLHDTLPETNGSASLWLSFAKKNIPEELRASFSVDFFKPHSQIKWLKPLEAVTLLTYHQRRVVYQPVINQLQQLFGIEPLIETGRSRHEHEFEAELIQLMKDIEPNYTHKTISRQVRTGCFCVDFKLSLSSGEVIYIEYDEEAHQTRASYRRRDRAKNKYFMNQKLKLVRVRRAEAEIWLNLVRTTKTVKSLEDFYSSLFRAANQSTKRHQIELSSASLKNILSKNNELQTLIAHPKQPLRSIKEILTNRLNITFSNIDKAIRFNETTLRNRCCYV